MSLLKAFLRIPWILWFVVAAGLCYMDYSSWQTDILQPLVSQLDAKRSELEQKKSAVAKADDFKARREEKLKELQDLGQQLDATKNEMPRSASIPDLLNTLANISDQAGLEFSKFHPESERRLRFLVETPISVTIKGTYLQTMSFLDAAANVGRFIATEKISFENPVMRGNVSILSSSVSLITYYLDEGAMNAPPPPPPNAKPGATPKNAAQAKGQK